MVDSHPFISFPIRPMGKKITTASVPCQACGKAITGKIHRFSGVPDSAFCSFDCQLSKTEIVVEELQLVPIDGPPPVYPVYQGPPPSRLHFDRFCECEEYFENQITVPKRHSLICFCPKCGCVTQD